MLNYEEIKRIHLDSNFTMKVETFNDDEFTIVDNMIVEKNGEAVLPVPCDEHLSISDVEKVALNNQMGFFHLRRINEDDNSSVMMTIADVNDNRISTTLHGGNVWSDDTKKEFFVNARDAMLGDMADVIIENDYYTMHVINRTEGGASELCGKLLSFIEAM